MKSAVVISSCQKYKNLWKPFFYFFKKFWPDCPYNIYLATDFGKYEGINVLEGKHASWSNNMYNVLTQVTEETFILLLDDFFLINKIENNIVDDYVDHMIENNIGCIRLFPCPGPDKYWDKRNDLGIISKGQPYRMSLQTALWNKEVFIKLLKNYENIWDMETKGTNRTNNIEEIFLSVYRQDPMENVMFAYVMGVLSGKWTEDAKKYCENNNLIIDYSI